MTQRIVNVIHYRIFIICIGPQEPGGSTHFTLIMLLILSGTSGLGSKWASSGHLISKFHLPRKRLLQTIMYGQSCLICSNITTTSEIEIYSSLGHIWTLTVVVPLGESHLRRHWPAFWCVSTGIAHLSWQRIIIFDIKIRDFSKQFCAARSFACVQQSQNRKHETKLT